MKKGAKLGPVSIFTRCKVFLCGPVQSVPTWSRPVPFITNLSMGLSRSSSGVARKAFERDDVGRLRFKVVSSKGEDWAYVDFRRNQLPADWKDGSYLQRFAAADASSPYPQASDALCKFYEKYESAKPKEKAPCATK